MKRGRPGRPKRGFEVAQLIVRMPVPLFHQIKAAAAAEGRSLSAQALLYIEAGLAAVGRAKD